MKHVAYLVWLVAALVWLFGEYCLSLFKNALAAAREELARELLSKCSGKWEEGK